MIDLHTHTTASDGRCTPARARRTRAAAGVTVLSVTDHDTVAGRDAARAACADAGIEFVAGSRSPQSATRPTCTSSATSSIRHRRRCLRSSRSSASGGRACAADGRRGSRTGHAARRRRDPAAARSRIPSTAIGRPWIARALVSGGYVATTNRGVLRRGWGAASPAFVPRKGAASADVIARIHDAGGIASIAHPGLLGRDAWIPEFVAAGLDAIEAITPTTTRRPPRATARSPIGSHLAVTGGSDFHGDESHGARATRQRVACPARTTSGCAARQQLRIWNLEFRIRDQERDARQRAT